MLPSAKVTNHCCKHANTFGLKLLLNDDKAFALAYVCGVLGTLIGAYLTNLSATKKIGAPIASIGGAGTFDGVFLSGIITVLLARNESSIEPPYAERTHLRADKQALCSFYPCPIVSYFTRTPLQKEAMAYNRLLKTNLVLLIVVLISIGASSFALYAGNKKFIGILGIALLALILILWRIFSLTRNQPTVSEQKQVDINFDLDRIRQIRPPQK